MEHNSKVVGVNTEAVCVLHPFLTSSVSSTGASSGSPDDPPKSGVAGRLPGLSTSALTPDVGCPDVEHDAVRTECE